MITVATGRAVESPVTARKVADAMVWRAERRAVLDMRPVSWSDGSWLARSDWDVKRRFEQSMGDAYRAGSHKGRMARLDKARELVADI